MRIRIRAPILSPSSLYNNEGLHYAHETGFAAGIALTSLVVQAASKDTAAPTKRSKNTVRRRAEFDKNLAQLQEQMKTMQAQMDQILMAKSSLGGDASGHPSRQHCGPKVVVEPRVK